MKKWRLSHHNVPTLFSWMHIYGQNPEFKQWLLANYGMDSFCKEDGRSSLLYPPFGEYIQKWMKPYTEADFQQTYYYLDQLMLDYNSGSGDLDSQQLIGETDPKNTSRGLFNYFAVDSHDPRTGWHLMKSFDLSDKYRRDNNVTDPAVRPSIPWVIRKRWHPPKVSREGQQLIGYKDNGTPKQEPEPPKKQGWFWGESGGAPDACTGNQYHVPLDWCY